MIDRVNSRYDGHSDSDELHWQHLLFLTEIPEALNTSAWQEKVADGIKALSSAIDHVVLNINRSVNLIDPEINRYGMTFRKNISTAEGLFECQSSSPTVHYSSSLPNDVTWPIYEQILADGVRQGFPSDRYHTPFGIDLRIGSEGYLGSVLIFSLRSGPPLPENTRTQIESMIPFLEQAFRHHILAFQHIMAEHLPDPVAEIVRGHAFTDRQRQTLALLIKGRSPDEIASMLNIAPKTVARHIDDVYHKLNVHSREHILRMVIKILRPDLL